LTHDGRDETEANMEEAKIITSEKGHDLEKQGAFIDGFKKLIL